MNPTYKKQIDLAEFGNYFPRQIGIHHPAPEPRLEFKMMVETWPKSVGMAWEKTVCERKRVRVRV